MSLEIQAEGQARLQKFEERTGLPAIAPLEVLEDMGEDIYLLGRQ